MEKIGLVGRNPQAIGKCAAIGFGTVIVLHIVQQKFFPDWQEKMREEDEEREHSSDNNII